MLTHKSKVFDIKVEDSKKFMDNYVMAEHEYIPESAMQEFHEACAVQECSKTVWRGENLQKGDHGILHLADGWLVCVVEDRRATMFSKAG